MNQEVNQVEQSSKFVSSLPPVEKLTYDLYRKILCMIAASFMDRTKAESNIVEVDSVKVHELGKQAFTLHRNSRMGKHGGSLILQDIISAAIYEALDKELHVQESDVPSVEDRKLKLLRSMFLPSNFAERHANFKSRTNHFLTDFLIRATQQRTLRDNWTYPVAVKEVLDDFINFATVVIQNPDILDSVIPITTIEYADQLAHLLLLNSVESCLADNPVHNS